MDALPQAIVNGLLAGTLLAVPAIGLSLMFAMQRFPNFAIGAHATIGAFAGFLANASAKLPVLVAVVAAFLVAGITGVLTDRLALRPLRPQGPLITAIASLALGVVLENALRFAFGNDLRAYDLTITRDVLVGTVRVRPQQLQSLVSAILVMAALFAVLKYTALGRALRAAADNAELAALRGIGAERITLVAVFVGTGLVGIGGMLVGLDTSIDPLTGTRILLSVFAAAVLGGLGSVVGAVVGALLIGIAEEVSVLAFPPAYRAAIAFAVIFLVLTSRPVGLCGARTA